MSNWTTIALADVRTAKNAIYLDNMEAQATANGDGDPLPGYIAQVISRLRGAISVGNQLDIDPTKIPNSLKDLALRMIIRLVKVDYLEASLTEDERKLYDEDKSYINRIIDQKIKFEIPDDAGGEAEMQQTGGLDIVTQTRREPWTRHGMDGLL